MAVIISKELYEELTAWNDKNRERIESSIKEMYFRHKERANSRKRIKKTQDTEDQRKNSKE